MVVNYEWLLNEKRLKTAMNFVSKDAVLILDEVHRVRNRKTRTHKAVKRLSRRASKVIGLSGTPLVRTPVDLVGIYVAMNPEVPGGFWGLINKFFLTSPNPFGGRDILAIANVDYFRNWLHEWSLCRSKPSEGWPTKQRVGVPLELKGDLKRWHDELWEEFMTEIGDTLVLTPTKLAALTRIRQLLVSPKLLDRTVFSSGSKLNWLHDFLEVHEETSVVVFSPFKEAFYLAGIHNIISGDVSARRREEVIRLFQSGEINVVGVSLTMAEGFELPRGRVGVFLGFDWNASTMRQAEDRLHRPSNPHDRVVYYYLYFENSPVERHLLDVVNGKLTWQAALFGKEEV